jgi:hypothetical protein
MSIEQRVRDLRRQERADEELALRPVRALYAPAWASIREACGAMAGGHEWQWAAQTVGGHDIYRCYRCMLREVRP